MIRKAISGHQAVEGEFVVWKVLMKRLLDCAALGCCHLGIALSLEAGVGDVGEGRRSFMALLSLAQAQGFCW